MLTVSRSAIGRLQEIRQYHWLINEPENPLENIKLELSHLQKKVFFNTHHYGRGKNFRLMLKKRYHFTH